MAIAAGSKAPPFKLYNTDRKQISSDDYNNLGAVVIGISVDMPFSLKAFKEKHNLNYELLSDFNKLTIHEYDMYHCNFICGIKGVAKRGVVVIDKNGMVAYSEETATTGTQVNFAALKEALQKLNNS
jgi:glutaredoxin-dependent peroxiredoxin